MRNEINRFPRNNTDKIGYLKDTVQKAPNEGTMDKQMICGFCSIETKRTNITQKGQVGVKDWETSTLGALPQAIF